MKFNISLATSSDIEILVKHRLCMWQDILESCEELVELPGNEARTRNWITEKLASGKLIGYVARTEKGEIAGSGCVWLREQPPLPFTEFVEGPYLLSMYTERKFRRRGIAESTDTTESTLMPPKPENDFTNNWGSNLDTVCGFKSE